jgi:phosphoserine phosphatase
MTRGNWMTRLGTGAGLLLLLAGIACSERLEVADPLPSWHASASKAAIIEFVTATVTKASPDFVPAAERIAVFDNDGTLWAEQPLYFQAFFIFDRIGALAPEHPEWATEEPFASVLKGDAGAALAGGAHALTAMAMATHTGMSSDEFAAEVTRWISTARHPVSGKLYSEMTYQPMLEVLQYLRANGYKTFIVSGGGIDFMRPWAERVYGVPPEQVVGSSVKVEYAIVDGKPLLRKIPQMNFIDDKEGKPVGIYQHIGRRPTMAFGNSDGDFQMLEWTTAGSGPRLGVYLHHDDAEREWAYDRDSHIGTLDRGLDEAEARRWVVISMRNDWRQVFPD